MSSNGLKSIIYDALYDVADSEFKDRNCCDFIENQCIKDRVKKTIEYCCDGCKYLIDHKCSVKSLGCKLSICQLVRERDDYMRGFLDALRHIKAHLQIPGTVRESEKDAFNKW